MADFLPPRDENTPTKTYTGGCHCERFMFEARHPIVEDGFPVIKCNCSICTQRGMLSIYITDPEKDFKLLKGVWEELSRYSFNTGAVSHKFCPTCGCTIFLDGNVNTFKLLAINLRAVRDVDLDSLTLKAFDGRAL